MPRSIHSLKTPSQIKISGRTSSITNAFVNGIMPFHMPSAQEMLDAVTALGMTPDDVRCSYCGDEATEWDHFNTFIDEKASLHLRSHVALIKAMKVAHLTAEIIRKEITEKFRRPTTSGAPGKIGK